MDLHLRDKHILITGASKGIGLACAQAFLAEGASVSLVARNPQTLAQAQALLAQSAEPARIHTHAADLCDAAAALAALDAAEAALGPVHVLVNSAGAAQRTPAAELTPAAWHAAMQAKYFSYIHMIDPTIKRMAQRGKGNIVNVVGNGGKVASPIHLPGGAANAALMLASAAVPITPPAPGLCINTTGCPSSREAASANERKMGSIEPPAGNGNTSWIGREGNAG